MPAIIKDDEKLLGEVLRPLVVATTIMMEIVFKFLLTLPPRARHPHWRGP